MLAPTGTIGLLMDCDTTGIEPDFALVKFKKLAGGGYFKIVNQSVPRGAASASATPEAQIQRDRRLRLGHQHAARRRRTSTARPLKQQGLTDDDLAEIEKALPGVFDLAPRLRARGCSARRRYERLGVTRRALSAPGFSLLAHLGFTDARDRRGATTSSAAA